MVNLVDSFVTVPMPYDPCHNKTVSDEISKKHKRSYNDNRIVIPLGLFIRETTQCILPYPP
jgi:hypothetical protein